MRIALSGKISLILSILFFIGGAYLLYKEVKTNTFIFYQSPALMFLCLSIGLFFHFRIKLIDAQK